MKPICMSAKDITKPFGDRCGNRATWMFVDQPCCDACAERWRTAMRDPHTILNAIVNRARTEEEIKAMLRPIQ
jgi:hypothetical protein